MMGIDLSQAWTMLEIAARAELSIAQEPQPATDAEIAPDIKPDWYLIEVKPGEDVRAMRWLARRRFGVFRPMQQRRIGPNKRRVVQGWEPVFPGWLFVFCWDVGRMYLRIVNCPGVQGILCDPVTQRPAPIDAPLLREDKRSCVWPRIGFIERLRALSWVYDETAPAARSHAAIRGARHAGRSERKYGLSPKQRRQLQQLKDKVRRKHLWDDEAWEHANLLDPGQRIALLRRTLNGTAVVGGSDHRA